MREKIYTIPVNEAFEQIDNCPFCVLYSRLENTEIELITGASMMSPDIRIKTNKSGFCLEHYKKMFDQKARLSLALVLQTHIAEVKKELSLGSIFSRDAAAKPSARIKELNSTCYVCEKIEIHFNKMFETAAILYGCESEFRDKLNSQIKFCLPHYGKFISIAKPLISKRWLDQFYKDCDKIIANYLQSLYDDLTLFTKKFDYNYKDVPWGTAKDSIERTIDTLCSKNV